MNERELIELSNLYLDSLAARDPSRLPVTKDVKFTENTEALALGQGLWQTASAIKYRHIVTDTISGQAGIFCTLHEGSEYLTLFALRLKTEDNRISEIETVVSRYAGMEVAFNPKTLVKPAPILDEMVPENERSSRKRMIEIADLYLEGLEKNSAESVPIHQGCNRLENGLQTTNNKDLGGFLALPCAEQMFIFAYMTNIRDRRYEIVDQERGLVWCMVMFDIPGKVKTAERPGYGTVQLPERTRQPRSLLLAEMFKIKGGLIHYIEAMIAKVPLGTKPGWP